MCVRKYMFGDKSSIGSWSIVIPKKGQQENIFFLYIQQGPIIYPSFKEKEVSHLTILLKVCTFFRRIRVNETYLLFYHLHTFQLSLSVF